MTPEELEAQKRALSKFIGQGNQALTTEENKSASAADTLRNHLSGKTREDILNELLKNR